MKKIQFKKNDDLLEIRKDEVFKAVFTKEAAESRGALSRLVSAMIGKKVTIVTILANEQPINNTEERLLRFDINCKTETGELVDVEMCYNPKSFEPVRLEFHTAKLFSGQNIKGKKKEYNDLKETYQIAILDKLKFFSDNVFYHSFEYYDDVNRVPLGGRTRIITLELSKYKDKVEKTAKEMSVREFWAYFFKYLTDASKRDKINEIIELEEGIAMASQVLYKISRDEEERARILAREKHELDLQSEFVYARKQGRAEGIRQGKAKGRAEGRAEGSEKRNKEVARNLKNLGASMEMIQKATDLSLEEIERL